MLLLEDQLVNHSHRFPLLRWSLRTKVFTWSAMDKSLTWAMVVRSFILAARRKKPSRSKIPSSVAPVTNLLHRDSKQLSDIWSHKRHNGEGLCSRLVVPKRTVMSGLMTPQSYSRTISRWCWPETWCHHDSKTRQMAFNRNQTQLHQIPEANQQSIHSRSDSWKRWLQSR